MGPPHSQRSRPPVVVADSGRAGVAWGAGIALAALVAYHNSFSVPLFFDDTASIVQNESIRGLWPLEKVLWPPTGAGTAGRPLLNLSFALNYAAGGMSVGGYHAVNLAIHVAAGWVLFGLVRRILRGPVMREKFGGAATELAGLSALLWVVHPLQTESVTYVSQRAESLVGLFYLVTWYAFFRGAEPEADERTARRWQIGAVAAFVAGILTKEIIATAPVVLLGFDAIFVAGSVREAWRRRRGVWLGFLGGWVLLGALMISSRLHERGVGFGGKMPWLDYVATEVEAVALYLKLSVWPHPLVIDYGVTPARGGAVLVASVVLVGAFVAGIIVAARKWPKVAFAGAAVLVMLAPTSSVVPVGNQPIAEHRMYLPLALIVTAVVVLGYARMGRRGVVAGGVVAVGCIGLTGWRNHDYRTEVAIWQDAATKRSDNWRAHATLGLAWLREQRVPEAIAATEVALTLNPAEPKLLNNYANALAIPFVGRLAEAITVGRRAVQLDPAYPEARNSLASALLRAGRGAEAVEQFQAARTLQPESAEIRTNLCDALRQIGRIGEAVIEGEAAVRLKPDFSVAQGNLGLALVAAGRVPEAMAHYETALRLQPDYVTVRNNLAVALLNAGRFDEAEAQLAAALQTKPDYPEAHNSLGIVWARRGRLSEAGAEFEAALRLRPDYPEAKENLRVLRAMVENK